MEDCNRNNKIQLSLKKEIQSHKNQSKLSKDSNLKEESEIYNNYCGDKSRSFDIPQLNKRLSNQD